MECRTQEPAVRPRSRPAFRVFAFGLSYLATLLSAGGAASIITGGARIADDHGIEFTLPENWPPGHPLPLIRTNCIRCHVDKGGALTQSVIDFARSSHDTEIHSCDTCHGGNIRSDEHAHEGDFISGRLSALMDRCTNCHFRERDYLVRGAHWSDKIRWDYPICSTCHDNHAVGTGRLRLETACNVCHGMRARAVTGEGESQIVWESVRRGESGNRIIVDLVADPEAGEVSIQIVPAPTDQEGGTRVRILLPADSEGKSGALAEDVIAAVRADPGLSAILQAAEGGDSLGFGEVEALGEVRLSGGSGFEDEFPAYADLIRGADRLRVALAVPGRIRDAETDRVRDHLMRMVHGSPAEPGVAEIDVLNRRIREALDRLEAAP